MDENQNKIEQKLLANGQICKNIKGRPLTDEEKLEKRERNKQHKEKMAKLKLKKEKLTESADKEQKSEFFDEESDVWVEEVVAPTPIELQDEEDVYVPPANLPTPKRQRAQQTQMVTEPEQVPQFKPIPPIGTSVDNPIVNADIYSVIERLYSDIGYFTLAEQVIQHRGESIRVVQLKLDDGRFVNLFARI